MVSCLSLLSVVPAILTLIVISVWNLLWLKIGGEGPDASKPASQSEFDTRTWVCHRLHIYIYIYINIYIGVCLYNNTPYEFYIHTTITVTIGGEGPDASQREPRPLHGSCQLRLQPRAGGGAVGPVQRSRVASVEKRRVEW